MLNGLGITIFRLKPACSERRNSKLQTGDQLKVPEIHRPNHNDRRKRVFRICNAIRTKSLA